MSKGHLYHYSPEDVSISIAGAITLSGFVEGTFITITRDNPLFQTHESSDGVVSRVKRNSKTFTVNITLMNTSESNDILSRMSLLDHSTSIVKFPLFIKDSLGGTVFFAGSSWIENTPSTAYSIDITDRQWSLKCTQASLYNGGNDSRSDVVEDLFNTISGLAPSLSRLF